MSCSIYSMTQQSITIVSLQKLASSPISGDCESNLTLEERPIHLSPLPSFTGLLKSSGGTR